MFSDSQLYFVFLQVLFPLFGQLDYVQEGTDTVDYSIW